MTLQRVPKEEHVPEDLGRAAKVAQVAPLLEALTGHREFAKLRGRVFPSLGHYMRDVLRATDSPTAAVTKLIADMEALKPFMRRYAQLTRDEQHAAARELLQALTDQEFVFSGETIPVDECTPVTLVVPDMKSLAEIMAMGTNPNPMLEFHVKNCRRSFSSLFGCQPEQQHGEIPLSYALLPGVTGTIAMLFQEDQADVLSRFNRATQDKISTWFFQIPTRAWHHWMERYNRRSDMGANLCSIKVALLGTDDIEKALFNDLCKEHPTFVSKGGQPKHGRFAFFHPTMRENDRVLGVKHTTLMSEPF